MARYVFKRYSELDSGQVDQVQAMEDDPANPLPIGVNDTARLYGYLHDGTVAAWAWGSATESLGELHLIVEKKHQQKKLGPRLALRYFIERNSAIERYQFAVTNPLLHSLLVARGFQHQPEDNFYLRDQFSALEIIDIQRDATSLNALASEFDAP